MDSIFLKIKKRSQKQIYEIRDGLIDLKKCIDRMVDSEVIEGLDQKAKKSLTFFSDRIKKEIEDISIPEEITYDNLSNMLKSMKRLFDQINDLSRKSFPKFQRDYQSEIKELHYFVRKLGQKGGGLDKFLRDKYKDVREAELLLNKLPKLISLKSNIENAKGAADNLNEESEEIKEKLASLEKELLKLEDDDLFIKQKDLSDKLFQLKIDINNHLKFKKALKKLSVDAEKGKIKLRNISHNDIKSFLKNPVARLSSDTKDLRNLSNILVQLRLSLESNELSLKASTRDSTIEQINSILSSTKLREDIDSLNNLQQEITKLEKKLNESGLATHLTGVKDKIASVSAKKEHVENDQKKKNDDYLAYLRKLKEDRESFIVLVEKVIPEKVKINITFIF